MLPFNERETSATTTKSWYHILFNLKIAEIHQSSVWDDDVSQTCIAAIPQIQPGLTDLPTALQPKQ